MAGCTWRTAASLMQGQISSVRSSPKGEERKDGNVVKANRSVPRLPVHITVLVFRGASSDPCLVKLPERQKIWELAEMMSRLPLSQEATVAFNLCCWNFWHQETSYSHSDITASVHAASSSPQYLHTGWAWVYKKCSEIDANLLQQGRERRG